MNKKLELELELDLYSQFNELSLHMPLRTLPLRTLPLRTLPLHILCIISDYSKPLTRPDWRICGKIRLVDFVECINTNNLRSRSRLTKVNYKSLINIIDINFKQSEMYIIGNEIYMNGLSEYLMNTKDNITYICNQPYLMLQHEFSYINLKHKRRLRESYLDNR